MKMKEYYFSMNECGRDYQEWYENEFDVLEFQKIIIETQGSPFKIKFLVSSSYCIQEGILFKNVKKRSTTIIDKDRINNFTPFLNFGVKMRKLTETKNQPRDSNQDLLTTKRYIEYEYIVAEIDENISSKMFEEYIKKVQNLGSKNYKNLIQKHYSIIDEFVLLILNDTNANCFSNFNLSVNGLFNSKYGTSYQNANGEIIEPSGLSFKDIGMENPNDICILCSIALAIYNTLTDEKLFRLFLERQNPNIKEMYREIASIDCNYCLIDDSIVFFIKKVNYQPQNIILQNWSL